MLSMIDQSNEETKAAVSKSTELLAKIPWHRVDRSIKMSPEKEMVHPFAKLTCRGSANCRDSILEIRGDASFSCCSIDIDAQAQNVEDAMTFQVCVVNPLNWWPGLEIWPFI